MTASSRIWGSNERIKDARVLLINLDTLDGIPVGVLQRSAIIGLYTVGIGLAGEVLPSPPLHIDRLLRPGLMDGGQPTAA
jgi:hypothetical protein